MTSVSFFLISNGVSSRLPRPSPPLRRPWLFSLMLTCFWLSNNYDWCPTMSYLAARHVPVFLCKNRFLLTRVCVCNNIKLASNVLHKIHTYKSMYVYFYAGLLTLTLCSRIAGTANNRCNWWLLQRGCRNWARERAGVSRPAARWSRRDFGWSQLWRQRGDIVRLSAQRLCRRYYVNCVRRWLRRWRPRLQRHLSCLELFVSDSGYWFIHIVGNLIWRFFLLYLMGGGMSL